MQGLKPALAILLAWTGLFLLLRLILIGWTWEHRGTMPGALIFETLWHGLRFDLSMAAKLTIPFALWSILRPRRGRKEGWLIGSAFGALALVVVVTLISEIQYYEEFQMRLGPLALEYFSFNPEHNAIIAGMIWHGFPVVRSMLAALALWTLFLWIARRSLRPASADATWPVRLASVCVWAFVTVVAARGGFQGSPLRWGDAYWSPNTYANQMTENGLFAIIDALRHPPSHRTQAAAWKGRMEYEDAVAEVRKTTLLSGERLVEPDRFPLLRISPESRIAAKRPRNVVVVMMESFSARFCGAVGASFGATPNFDALAREGILFDRAFSAGTHTAQGVFATLCSVPTLPDFESIMKLPEGQQLFRSLPALFREAGCETVFLYNGLFSWDNKEGFFRHQGVQEFVGREDYVSPLFVDPDWGVSDMDVFLRALDEFDARSRGGQRFLGMILTLSNHAPFNLPSIEGLAPITEGGEQVERLNGVHYADWALGQFMQRARQSEWFDDTLFVLVGDHGFAIPPNVTDLSLLHMHVPLLFYGPKIFGGRHEIRHTVAGQLDILPTIVGLAGLETPHQGFGRDLFSLPASDPGHAYVKRSGEPILGWIQGEYVAVAASGKPTQLHRIQLGFPPAASDDLAAADPERTRQMARALDAEVVTGITLLDSRLAAPAPARSARRGTPVRR